MRACRIARCDLEVIDLGGLRWGGQQSRDRETGAGRGSDRRTVFIDGVGADAAARSYAGRAQFKVALVLLIDDADTPVGALGAAPQLPPG
jgi:hypothetical protein